MRLARIWWSGLAAALALAGLGVAGAGARTTYHLYCGGYPWMDNVPRGSLIAASNTLCVARNNSDGRFMAYNNINPPDRIQIAARLHVELTRNGRAVANSREYMTPRTPVVIRTGWASSRGGRYCAILWNHGVLGYYQVEKICHRF